MDNEHPKIREIKESSDKSKRQVGCFLGLFGLVFGFSPLIYAAIAAPRGADAAGFILIATLPIGVVIGTIGTIIYSLGRLPKQTVVPSSDGKGLSAATAVASPAFSKFSLISSALSPAIIYLVPMSINFGIYAPEEVRYALTFAGLVFAILAQIKKERFAPVAIALAIVFNLINIIFFATMYFTLNSIN